MVKYVGTDVHGQTTTFTVLQDERAAPVAVVTVATRAESILEYIRGLTGEVQVAVEEGAQARWFRGLIRRYVKEVIVCDPRKNTARGPLRNKSDRADSLMLAQLLRKGDLVPVYHGDEKLDELRQLVRNFQTLTEDGVRTKNRIKALFRARGNLVAGAKVYSQKHREDYLEKAGSMGIRVTLVALYAQMDLTTILVAEARKTMVTEARKYVSWRLLNTVPGIGPISASLLVATIGTPHRFPTKQTLWAYCGLAVVQRSTGDFVQTADGGVVPRRKPKLTLGLNRNRNPHMKQVFKSAVINAMQYSEIAAYYQKHVDRGLEPTIARVQVARKLATIVLTLMKTGKQYDKELMRIKNALPSEQPVPAS